jgi:uncharacterized protein HemX
MTGGLGWVGAAIALATTVASGIFSSRQAKKQAAANKEAQAAAQELQLAQNQAALIELEKLKLQQDAELAAEKEKENKIIKYGAILATGLIIYQALKD